MPDLFPPPDPELVARALLQAQDRAQELFHEVVAGGLIAAGKSESELATEIVDLARSRFDVSRHWHKRIVRAGENTLMGYYDEPAERRIEADDVVYLDFGPLFETWEADFGRTYALGSDPVKHRLVTDIGTAFARGKAHYRDTPALTAGQLYDYVVGLAGDAGWEFGAVTAGHLVGHFPHERDTHDLKRFSIRHGNTISLREPDANGNPRNWILEIHFIDRQRRIGGFFEELLTVERSQLESSPAAVAARR